MCIVSPKRYSCSSAYSMLAPAYVLCPGCTNTRHRLALLEGWACAALRTLILEHHFLHALMLTGVTNVPNIQLRLNTYMSHSRARLGLGLTGALRWT